MSSLTPIDRLFMLRILLEERPTRGPELAILDATVACLRWFRGELEEYAAVTYVQRAQDAIRSGEEVALPILPMPPVPTRTPAIAAVELGRLACAHCDGRGWTARAADAFPVPCASCGGRGSLSMRRLEQLLGTSTPTLTRLLTGKVRAATAERLFTRIVSAGLLPDVAPSRHASKRASEARP